MRPEGRRANRIMGLFGSAQMVEEVEMGKTKIKG